MFSRYVGLMEIADQNDDELLQGRTATTTDQRQKKIKTHFVTCRLTNYFYYLPTFFFQATTKIFLGNYFVLKPLLLGGLGNLLCYLLAWCLSQIIVILQLLLALYLYTFYY